MATISVTNTNTTQTLDVCLSSWGSNESTAYATIAPNQTHDFTRTDPRGFVMMVRNGSSGQALPYYVLAGDAITASSATSVTDNGVRLQTIARNQQLTSTASGT